jgi:hypothetical protein
MPGNEEAVKIDNAYKSSKTNGVDTLNEGTRVLLGGNNGKANPSITISRDWRLIKHSQIGSRLQNSSTTTNWTSACPVVGGNASNQSALLVLGRQICWMTRKDVIL